MSPKLLTINDCVAATNTGRSTLYKELLSGRLESVTIGRRRLIPEEALENYIEMLRDEAKADLSTIGGAREAG